MSYISKYIFFVNINVFNVFQIHAYCENPDIVLCGNKNDMDHLRVISEVRAREFAEKYNLVYIETSAQTGNNIRRAVDILLDKVMIRYK